MEDGRFQKISMFWTQTKHTKSRINRKTAGVVASVLPSGWTADRRCSSRPFAWRSELRLSLVREIQITLVIEWGLTRNQLRSRIWRLGIWETECRSWDSVCFGRGLQVLLHGYGQFSASLAIYFLTDNITRLLYPFLPKDAVQGSVPTSIHTRYVEFL